MGETDLVGLVARRPHHVITERQKKTQLLKIPISKEENTG